jgi:hypothetical protein
MTPTRFLKIGNGEGLDKKICNDLYKVRDRFSKIALTLSNCQFFLDFPNSVLAKLPSQYQTD